MSTLDDLSRWVDESAGLLLGLDFDGTLAPIVDDPSEAALTPATRAVLEKFARASSVVPAVVSGRGRDDLMRRVDVDGIAYAGNHGLELAYGGTETVHPAAAKRRSTIARLCDEIETRLRDVPGCAVENKGVTATVHFRRTPDDAVPTLVSTVEDVVSDVARVELTEGKQIREIRPAVEWDKGEAMKLLSEAAPDDWRAMYIGDDTTDEDAFRAIRPDGVGVQVVDSSSDERSTDTAAGYRLDGQREVSFLLAWVGMSLNTAGSRESRQEPLTLPLRFTDARSEGK
jgi:trehalose 6-phosphate phosphatase